MTKQLVDTMIIEGKTYNIAVGYPLKEFLNTQNIRFITQLTCCYRGYVATWELKDKQLYLVKLQATIEGQQEVALDYLFPEQKEVFAQWFTGKLMLSQGEIIKQGSIADYYQDYLVLEFDKGILIQQSHLDGQKYLIQEEQKQQEKDAKKQQLQELLAKSEKKARKKRTKKMTLIWLGISLLLFILYYNLR